MNRIENKVFDEERSLYNLKDTIVLNCTFKGEKDGESPLKEARNIRVDNSYFSLRYPLWHVHNYLINNTNFDINSRAPLWYTLNGKIINCVIEGIKTLRESKNIEIENCHINSSEFGWKSNNIKVTNSNINSEYIFLDSNNVHIKNINFTGKYSFQYMKNVTIEDSILNTKDAFWHSENIIVKNSTINGEYLGWFSKNLTFINCKIIGTQPLCYCEKLKLINSEMINTDLSFEYSDVNATIKGRIESIKNPRSGKIIVDEVGNIIKEDSIMKDNCKIIINK